jgi:DNA-binding response OmpR family regulator
MSRITNKLKFEAEGKSDNAPAKILIVDDDAGLREILSEILTEEGYNTQIAQTGKEAIEKCHKEPFDFALIDIKLPDVDGTQLLDLMKQFPAMIKIMITGYPSLENAVQSLNSGADGYLVKPIKPLNLLNQIKDQLKRRQKATLEKLLMNTGLSSYEAKIYLALAAEGDSEVRKLSISSGVPRTKAYQALKKLTQIGLVVEIPGETQKFSVVTPSSAFSNFVQNWKRELTEQATTLTELEKTISILDSLQEEKQVSEPLSMHKEEVWSITGTGEIEQRIEEMLIKAQNSVLVETTENGLALFCRTHGKVLDDLAAKGIKIQIKVPIGPSNKNFVNELKYVYKVENAQVPVPIIFLIIDENEVLLRQLKTDDPKTAPDKDLGLFAKSEKLVAYFSELFCIGKYK